MRSFIAAMMFWFWSGLAHAEAPSWRSAPESTAVAAAMQAERPEVPSDWQVYSDPYATVYAAEGDKATALHLSRYVARSLPRISEEMGLPIGNRIHIYIAPSQEEFFTLQPGNAPQWADGTAYPHRGLIFLRAPHVRSGSSSPLEQVLDHELAHILLGRAFGARPVPRWLQEGTAQLVAREYTSALTDRIGAGMFGDDLLTLEELTRGFPDDPLRAQLAYAQSADFVAFLTNRYGPETLHGIIHEMVAGAPFAAAVRATTGVSIDTIDTQWRQRLESSSMLWLRPLVSDTMILSLAGFGFLGLGALALRRRRQQLRDMADDEEAMEVWYAQLSAGFDDTALYGEIPDAHPLSSAYDEEAHRSVHGPH